VGACRGDELDSAGCRFYITLKQAPYLDGKLHGLRQGGAGAGRGRTIFQKPDTSRRSGRERRRRPEKPVVIRQSEIQVGSREAPGGDPRKG